MANPADDFLAERMALAFALNARAAAVNALVALLAAWALAGGTPSSTLVAWLAAIGASLVLRLGVGLARSRDVAADRHALGWAWVISAALATTGLAWGSGAALMLDPGDPLREAFWVVALCGIGAGAVSALPHFQPALWAYLLPLLLPAIWRYARQPEPAQWTVAGGLALFLVVGLSQGRQGARALRESLAMRAANAGLVAELTARNEQALAARRLAEEAAAAKARFFAAASHDLRQPMQALLLLDAALADAPAERQPALRHRQSEGLQDLARLFEDILEVSHLDAGAPVAASQPVPLAALADRVQARFAAEAEASGARLRLRGSRHAGAVLADATALERLLGNLVANALRHAPGRPVLLAWRRGDAATVRLQVRDGGDGIAPEFQSRVFEEFFQVENPHRDRRRGTGLGLAIASRLAQGLGGRLALRSVPGRGCCFELRLPAARLPADTTAVALPTDAAASTHERSATARPVTGAAPDARRLVAWIVDDDARVGEALAALLGGWGLQVTAVTTPTALPSLRDGRPADGSPPPDLLLCDQMLADDDGVALAQRLLAALQPPPRALVMSGNPDPAARDRARHAGLAWLAKPVRPLALRALLGALMADRAALADARAADGRQAGAAGQGG